MEHHKPASKVPAFLNVTDIAGEFTTWAAFLTSNIVYFTDNHSVTHAVEGVKVAVELPSIFICGENLTMKLYIILFKG